MADTFTYHVPGMHCAGCTRAVEYELRAVRGVEAVEADLATKRVTVTATGVSDEALREAIAGAGYEAER